VTKKTGILFFLIFLAGEFNAQIHVEKIDKQSLEKIIKERNGKILLFNFWATWCVPCREEFPDIIRISSEYKNHDIEVIGISIDFDEDLKTKVIPFLKKQKVNFVNYVSGFRNDEELINLINKKWNGAIPATAIYGRNGKQISFLEGRKSYQEFKSAIEKARIE
jgi:thiol-disulfide isomerase/thioredoxin